MKIQRNKKPTDPNQPIRADGLETDAQRNASSLEDRIRQRAHEIHQARGAAPAQELDDWLQAEREIKAAMDQTSEAQG
jgi:hypothetical protein